MDPSTINTTSNILESNSKILPRFLDSHYQNFSIPDSLIYYIIKNPSTKKAYQKMIKLCKYFFDTNPILILGNLFYNETESWYNYDFNICKKTDIKTIEDCKFWITTELAISSREIIDQNITSSLIPKIFQCKIISLTLGFQVISYNELLFFAPTTEYLIFYSVTVKNNDGTVTKLEKIVETFSTLECIQYYDNLNAPSITAQSFKELLKIQHFQKINYFKLFDVPETIDIETFYLYIKKNKHTTIVLDFCQDISEAFKARLEAIIDNIIDSAGHDFKAPYISFSGIDQTKWVNMFQIYQNPR